MLNSWSLLSDITSVGPNKPLGYLPVESIESAGFAADDLAQDLEKQGLQTFKYTTEHLKNVFLYAYHSQALESLLQQPQHQLVLKKYRWPDSADQFVARVAAELVPRGTKPDLFRLIALAFNDKVNAQ